MRSRRRRTAQRRSVRVPPNTARATTSPARTIRRRSRFPAQPRGAAPASPRPRASPWVATTPSCRCARAGRAKCCPANPPATAAGTRPARPPRPPMAGRNGVPRCARHRARATPYPADRDRSRSPSAKTVGPAEAIRTEGPPWRRVTGRPTAPARHRPWTAASRFRVAGGRTPRRASRGWRPTHRRRTGSTATPARRSAADDAS